MGFVCAETGYGPSYHCQISKMSFYTLQIKNPNLNGSSLFEICITVDNRNILTCFGCTV